MRTGPLACPRCGRFGVERLYLAGAHLDVCACAGCGHRWDERPAPRRARRPSRAAAERR